MFDPSDTESKLSHVRKWLEQMGPEQMGLEQMAADCFTTKPDLLFDVFCVAILPHGGAPKCQESCNAGPRSRRALMTR